MIQYFATRNFRGTCSSDEMLKGYMVRERLGTPALMRWFPTRKEFLPREAFHSFRGGISTLCCPSFLKLASALSIRFMTFYL